MKMKIIGTGTSHGVPVIGCDCSVCTSKDPKDKRYRSSAWIFDPVSLVIDTGPEFRIQCLENGIKKLDGVLITHSHADHLHGIDDLRIFSHTKSYGSLGHMGGETEGEGLKFIASHKVIEDIKFRFDYIFKEIKQGGGRPKIKPVDASNFSSENPLKLKNLKITPIPMKHGFFDDTGWLFTEEDSHGAKKSMAYLTDTNFIPEESFKILNDTGGTITHLVIDGLRIRGHSTHFSFIEALEAAEKIRPQNVYLTHITHDSSHEQIIEYINENINKFPHLEKIKENGGTVEPAYDGLILEN